MPGALDGIRVVEFANYVSGPYAGMLLGDLGAEVIKVEAPDGGDPFRGWGRVEYSPTFGSVNRNKKSMVLDLKSADGARRGARAHPHRRRPDREFPHRHHGAARARLRRRGARQSAPGLVLDHRLRHDRSVRVASGLRHRRPSGERAPQPVDRSRPSAPDGHFAVRPSRRHHRVQRHPRRADRPRPHRQGPARRHLAARGDRVVLRRKCRALFRKQQGAGSRHSHPSGTGLCLRRRRRQTVRDPPLDADQILAGARRASPASRNGLPIRASPPRRRAAATTTCCTTGSPPSSAPTRRAAWLDKLQADDVPAAPLNTLDEVFDDPQVKHLGLRQDVPHKRVGSRRTGAQRRAHVGDAAGDPLRLARARRTHRRNPGASSRSARDSADAHCGIDTRPSSPAGALLPASAAHAQTVADFYRGKRITLVTSASVGGGYDQYARLLAKHMQRHIPGEPTIIVQNMVGAEGLRAANFLYNVARAGRHRDRRTVAQHRTGAILRFQQCRHPVRRPEIPLARLAAAGSRAVHPVDQGRA